MITFESVTKTFGTGDSALESVSFHIEPGEFVFITGPSGSGKTTIMRLLTREYIPSEGEITFNDQALSKISGGSVHHHRRKIGVVFQDYKLLPELNVWENIALPLSIIGKKQAEIEERVTDLLNLVQLTDKAHLFPVQLSGGEAQRISIARALAAAPDVIFADEPTGNLDAETSQSITKLLHKINQLGTTVLMATHDPVVLDAISDARRIELKNGKLVKDSGAKKQRKPDTTEPDPQDESTDDSDEAEDTSSQKKAPETDKEATAHSRRHASPWAALFGGSKKGAKNKKKSTKDKKSTKKETS